MRRFWIHRESDDEEIIGAYFVNEVMAELVAEALEEETDNEYYVRG